MRINGTTRLALCLIISPLFFAFAGCASAPATKPARYDFGDGVSQRSAVNASTSVTLPALSAIHVSASSWLAGRDMHYRLLYAEPLRRFTYAEAQWAAPPAELLERHLRQGLLFARADDMAASCRLGLVLTELDQRFTDAERSAIHLAVQASMQPARGDTAISRQLFTLDVPSASADARGGVAATGLAVRRLEDEIGQWLAALPSTVSQRCQTGKN